MVKYKYNIENIDAEDIVRTDNMKELKKGTKISLSTSLTIGISEKSNNIIRLNPQLKYKVQEKVYLDSSINIYFRIDEVYWNKYLVNNQITLKKDLLVQLYNDSINILRGYLFSKIVRNDQKPFILIQINSDIIKKDVILDFNDNED